MSGGKGGSQTTQVEIPSWIQQPSIRNMARAEALQKVGYMPYMGPDVAAFAQPQQQAMQSNLDAAAAFGLVAPGMDAMAGMPQATPLTYGSDGLPNRTGLQGYSSYPMYQKAVNDFESQNPGQARAYNNLFVNPNSPGSDNTGGGFDPDAPFDPSNYNMFDPNPLNVGAFDSPDGPGSNDLPDGTTENAPISDSTDETTQDVPFLTRAQLDEYMLNRQGPDLSGYATVDQLSNLPFYDDSQLRQDINSRFETFNPNVDLSGYAQTSDLYNDAALRADINSRFNQINTFDPSNLQAQILANQQALNNLPQSTTQDLSDYVTSTQLGNALDTIPQFDPTSLAAQIAANQAAIGNFSQYDDTQLRQDINSRFDGLPTYDTAGLQAQITANQLGLANLPNAQMPDLSGYATTGDLETAITGIPQFDPTGLQSQITANQTAIGNVPQYNDQGLLAAIQANQNAISNFTPYDDTQLRQDINNRFTNFNPNVDLSNYATNASVDTLVNNLPTGQPQDLSNYVTNEQFTQGLQNIPTPTAPDLSNYALRSDLYNDTQLRQDINNRFNNFTPNIDLSNYATNASVDTLMNNLPTYQAPDMSGYATTDFVNNRFNNFSNPDLSSYATTDQLINVLTQLGLNNSSNLGLPSTTPVVDQTPVQGPPVSVAAANFS